MSINIIYNKGSNGEIEVMRPKKLHEMTTDELIRKCFGF